MTPTHALAASGFDPARGALYVKCRCGWEDTWFPPDPLRYDDATAKQEDLQLLRFQGHVLGATRRDELRG